MGHNGEVWEEARLVRNWLKTEHGGLKEKPITVVGCEDEDQTILSKRKILVMIQDNSEKGREKKRTNDPTG
jgi:hypothetical protein